MLHHEAGRRANLVHAHDMVHLAAQQQAAGAELIAAMMATGMDEHYMGVALHAATSVHNVAVVRVLMAPHSAGAAVPEPAGPTVAAAAAGGFLSAPAAEGVALAAHMVDVEGEEHVQDTPPADHWHAPTQQQLPEQFQVPQLPQLPQPRPPAFLDSVLASAAQGAEERQMEGATELSLPRTDLPHVQDPEARAALQEIVGLLMGVAVRELDYVEGAWEAAQAATHVAAAAAAAGQPQVAAAAREVAAAPRPSAGLTWDKVLVGALQTRDAALVQRLLASHGVRCRADDEQVLDMAACVCAADGDASFLLTLVHHGAELQAVLYAACRTRSLALVHQLLVAAEAEGAAAAAAGGPGCSGEVWDDVLGWLTPEGDSFRGHQWVCSLGCGGDRLVEAVARAVTSHGPGTEGHAVASACLSYLLTTHGGRPGAALQLPQGRNDCVSPAHTALLQQLLHEYGADVIIRGGPHTPATVGAAFARSGSAEHLFTVITHGACPNAALHATVADPAIADRLQVVQRLLAGVPRGPGGDGQTSIVCADAEWQDGLAVREAAGLGDFEVTELLLAAGANANAALLVGVRAGQQETALHLMLQHGASPAWRNYFALSAAAELKDLRLLEAMLARVEEEMGTLVPAALMTALDGAVAAGHVRGVRLLVEAYHADPRHSGDQPVRLAAQSGRATVVDVLLQQYGADPQAALCGAVLGRQLAVNDEDKDALLEMSRWLVAEWCAGPEGEAMSLALEAGDEPLVALLLECQAA